MPDVLLSEPCITQISIYRAQNAYKHHGIVLETGQRYYILQLNVLNEKKPETLAELLAMKNDSAIQLDIGTLDAFLFGSPLSDVHIERRLRHADNADAFLDAVVRFIAIYSSRSRIRYHMLRCNCEHVSTFILTGQWQSIQADEFVMSLFVAKNEFLTGNEDSGLSATVNGDSPDLDLSVLLPLKIGALYAQVQKAYVQQLFTRTSSRLSDFRTGVYEQMRKLIDYFDMTGAATV